jgi:hypothetical protein
MDLHCNIHFSVRGLVATGGLAINGLIGSRRVKDRLKDFELYLRPLETHPILDRVKEDLEVWTASLFFPLYYFVPSTKYTTL